jgi:hypothetical protein
MLLQIASLDGWTGQVHQMKSHHPMLLIPIFVFLIFTTLGLLNVIIGVS